MEEEGKLNGSETLGRTGKMTVCRGSRKRKTARQDTGPHDVIQGNYRAKMCLLQVCHHEAPVTTESVELLVMV